MGKVYKRKEKMFKKLRHIIWRIIPHKHRYIVSKHNSAKRYCKFCDHEQWLYYSKMPRMTYWDDSPMEKIYKLDL